MKDITLTIDGKACKGAEGNTILEVARRNDVYIPTLCFLEGLTPIGSCRMCVVEVEKNPKMLQPAPPLPRTAWWFTRERRS